MTPPRWEDDQTELHSLGDNMIKKAALIAGVLLLAGCGAPSLPEERPEPNEMCGIDTKSASTQPEVLDLSLYSCGSVAEWLSGMQKAGQQVDTVESLAETCSGQDSAPVCAGAIEEELIESTGNGGLGRVTAAAEWCGVADGIADEGGSLSVTAEGLDAVVTPECLLAKLQARPTCPSTWGLLVRSTVSRPMSGRVWRRGGLITRTTGRT